MSTNVVEARRDDLCQSAPAPESKAVRLAYETSEYGAAQRFSDRFNNRLRYCPELGSWLAYDGITWNQIGSEAVIVRVGELVNDLRKELKALRDQDDDEFDPPQGNPNGRRKSDLAIPVTIEIEADCTVNYAMQQNDVPVIKMLRITNTQDHVLRDLLVHVTAEPAFASSMDLRITAIDPGATYNLGLIDLQLAHDYLASLTERVVGAVHIDVYQGEVCLAHSSTRIDVLAYDEWNGLQSLPEIIAAFVTPNHPAIDGILSDSASILREWTGDPSLSGYQARDGQRVFHSVGAIYTALQRQHITYTNPPASFEERGQKIRLPDRILEHHLGTCLDLTVLLASCLEQMGLFPLIVITEAGTKKARHLGEHQVPIGHVLRV